MAWVVTHYYVYADDIANDKLFDFTISNAQPSTLQDQFTAAWVAIPSNIENIYYQTYYASRPRTWWTEITMNTTLPDLWIDQEIRFTYSDPETITSFYLDWTEYKFDWWWTAEWVTTTQPSNPVAGSTYYDTTNNVIKVYNWTSWEEVGWGNVIAMTQSEYDALPAATKNDGKLRIITDASTLDIVDDTAFGASWDWDTDTAPSKNAVYDAIWNIETLLAAI